MGVARSPEERAFVAARREMARLIHLLHVSGVAYQQAKLAVVSAYLRGEWPDVPFSIELGQSSMEISESTFNFDLDIVLGTLPSEMARTILSSVRDYVVGLAVEADGEAEQDEEDTAPRPALLAPRTGEGREP